MHFKAFPAICLLSLAGCSVFGSEDIQSRLKRGDATVCADPTVQRVFQETYGGAEYQRYAANGGEQVPMSAVSALEIDKEVSSVSCSASLQVPRIGAGSALSTGMEQGVSLQRIQFTVRPALESTTSFVVEVPRDSGSLFDTYLTIFNLNHRAAASQPAVGTETAATSEPETASESGAEELVNGSCRVTHLGRPIMQGTCSGKASDRTIVVTDDHSGCTVEISRSTPNSGPAKLYPYRDTCWLDEAKGVQVESDVGLGRMTLRDGCWVGTSSEICLTVPD